MTFRLSSILLLLTILLGSIAGPHPCWADQTARGKAAPSSMAGMEGMSCHGPVGAEAPAQSPSQDDAQKRQQTMCEKACSNRLAVLAVRLPEIAPRAATWTPAVAPVRLLPLLAEPIDHIPLA
jgi:hypothetical protein